MKNVLIIIGILALIVLVFLWYAGFFNKIVVNEREEGGYVVAGEEFTGAYAKVGPTMNKVDSLIRELGVECTRGFGIYYDDPKVTPKEECRSYVGNVIEEKDFEHLESIKALGLKMDSIQKTCALVIEFPVRSVLSYMVGPMKAYPALTEYSQEKSMIPVLLFELYDVPDKKAYYIMQYSK